MLKVPLYTTMVALAMASGIALPAVVATTNDELHGAKSSTSIEKTLDATVTHWRHSCEMHMQNCLYGCERIAGPIVISPHDGTLQCFRNGSWVERYGLDIAVTVDSPKDEASG